jgi:hypothetical protein
MCNIYVSKIPPKTEFEEVLGDPCTTLSFHIILHFRWTPEDKEVERIMGHENKQPMSTYMATLLKQCPSNCRMSLVSDNANQHKHAAVLTQFSIDFGTRNKMWRQKSENDRRESENDGRKSEKNRGARPITVQRVSTCPSIERRPRTQGRRSRRERRSSVNIIPNQPVGLKPTRLQESLSQYATKSRRQTWSAPSGLGFAHPEKQAVSPLLGSMNIIPNQPVGLKPTRLQESLSQYATKSRRQTWSAPSGLGFAHPEKQAISPLLGRAA